MIALGGCAHAPGAKSQAITLDELLAFADPSRCEPGPAHRKLLDAMVAGDSEAGLRPGQIEAAMPYSRAFGRVSVKRFEHYTVAAVPVRGNLFGLPIVAVEQSLPDGGDPGDTSYRFRAAPEFVEGVLAARGFPVKLGRNVAIGPPDGYEHFIELIADRVHAGHTLLSCGHR